MASYNTNQKKIIINLLKENNDHHLNIDEMQEILKEKNESVSRATLYRTLDLLVNSGVVRKYVIGESEKACFQYIDDDECHNHIHLVCEKCGKLFHLDCDKFHDIIDHIEDEHGFSVSQSRLVLYGICKECARKEDDNHVYDDSITSK